MLEAILITLNCVTISRYRKAGESGGWKYLLYTFLCWVAMFLLLMVVGNMGMGVFAFVMIIGYVGCYAIAISGMRSGSAYVASAEAYKAAREEEHRAEREKKEDARRKAEQAQMQRQLELTEETLRQTQAAMQTMQAQMQGGAAQAAGVVDAGTADSAAMPEAEAMAQPQAGDTPAQAAAVEIPQHPKAIPIAADADPDFVVRAVAQQVFGELGGAVLGGTVDQERLRVLGGQLNAICGMGGMQDVASQVMKRYPMMLSTLSRAWDGVGDWAD